MCKDTLYKEQIAGTNDEIIGNFFKDMRSILYTRLPLKTQLKMLYTAKYHAEYMMQLNNNLLRDHLKEK